jgi:ankyrin repeat protein
LNIPDKVDPVDTKCTAAILTAVQEGRVDEMRALAEQGADLINTITVDGITPSFVTANFRDADMIRAAVDVGAEYAATQNRDVGMIRLLAELGANMNTPLW